MRKHDAPAKGQGLQSTKRVWIALVMDTRAEITLALEMMLHHADLPWLDQVARLEAAGVDRDRAMRLVQMVPIAFCHEHYKNTGVRFSRSYILVDEAMRQTPELPFKGDPIYVEAARIAASEEDAMTAESRLIIVRQTAEYNVIHQLRGSDDRLDGIILTAPLMNRDRIDDLTHLGGAHQRRPWWMWWKR